MTMTMLEHPNKVFIPPEEEAIASKACEIHYCQFEIFEFCPMQQKTIPVENHDNSEHHHHQRGYCLCAVRARSGKW